MKNKLTVALILFLILITPISIRGLREILLRDFDCPLCRRTFSLIYRPHDYNLPIAIGQIVNGEANLAIFPKYTGPYVIQLYGGAADVRANLTEFVCTNSNGLRVTEVEKPVRIRTGRGLGLNLGSIYLTPKQIHAADYIVCKLRINSSLPFKIVVARRSEL